ncbi:MAG: BamA/TamA family outer membrane protein [Gemmatimonadaceae bacterium]|nr:BamA/TamA family outer membrane protein [Gemmatimonadaceae bacterium]
MRSVCALLFVLLGAGSLAAQVDPRGPIRTITTPHFHVHFAARLDSVARAAAVYAEGAYAQLSGELVAPRGRIDLLVADNVDFSNGYAQVFPTPRVVIYATPPIAAAELRYTGDWLRSVITHELAHVFHLDRARGVWALGRWVLGRNPVLFPNTFTPSWVKEGLAVHYESKFTGFGRDVSTEFPSLLRAAARDSLLMPLGRWSLSATRYPRGNAAYLYGATVMEQAARSAPAGKGMRRYVDATAAMLVPYLPQYNATIGFGRSFNAIWAAYRDSLTRAPIDTTADRFTWVSAHGYFANGPRWLSADSLVYAASDGRRVTGLYAASVRGGAPRRLGWKTSLDTWAVGPDGLVGAQNDFLDPYTVRADLYWDCLKGGKTYGGKTNGGKTDCGGERRLTTGARLVMPDVRRDGEIVAIQLAAGTSSLVRVSPNGQSVRVIAAGAGREMWAEPRWHPSGAYLTAVQLLGTGEQRVMVLDTLGHIWQAVAGGRGVSASPSFTPKGDRLVWASDRSGRMQLETAPLGDLEMLDTLRWREAREEVRQASRVSTAVYEPTVSPDGRSVAVLVQRGDGLHAAVLPLDTAGAMATNAWYTTEPVALPTVVDPRAIASLPATRYSALRMLLPRYWLPSAGQGRDGRPTTGFITSGDDILGRHLWQASALIQPERREVDGYALYRFAGLGVPVFDLSMSQQWDATFGVVNTARQVIGSIARRKRFATLSSTVSVPRVRWAMSGTLGAQYEWRDFTATADSLLGPANSLLRTGTRYPTLFVNTNVSTARRALRSVSVEEGVTLSTSSAYRWRLDAPELGSWRHVASARAYAPLDFAGYARHVIALRAAAGVTDEKTATEFSVGGVSGLTGEVFPGVNVGDPARTFSVRGVAPAAQRGIRALAASAEYRAPLTLFSRVPSPLTFYSDKLSLTVFSDAGRAWCPGAFARQATSVGICERPGVRDGWIASAGAELVLDAALAYDVPYRFRLGVAAPYAAPTGVARKGAVYFTLGGYF